MLVFKVFAHENVTATKEKSKFSTLAGQVLDKETRQPLVGTNIVIVGTGKGGSTDLNGSYRISFLPPGWHSIEFSYIGYQKERIEGIQLLADADTRLDVQLAPQPLRLSEIIVTPGQFAVMGRQPVLQQTLTKENLQTIPFGEDIFRAITRLPGVAADDYSAKFTLRGGKNEEILVLLDGQQLYEPFHLKDLEGGALSMIDFEAIDGIDLYTGGYPAQFGDCLSGVFDIKSAGAGAENSQTTLGLSFMNARFMSRGHFQERKGSWLFSARRGYLDLVLNLMEEEEPPLPTYHDIYYSLNFKKSDYYNFSINILHSGDKLSFEEDNGDAIHSRYGNSYGWFTWKSIITPRLFQQSILSFGRMTHDRNGIGHFEAVDGIKYQVADENQVNLFGFKQDWDQEVLDSWSLKYGYYLNYETARYDYVSSLAQLNWIDQGNYSITTDSTIANLKFGGERLGGYFSSRFRIITPLTVELGLRYDRNGCAREKHLSPRINLAYAPGKHTVFRGGWGYFYQSQHLHEVKVAYGETGFFPAQLSKHWVVGVEHTFGSGLNLRLEGYYKKISNPRADHRIFSNTIEMFPEMEDVLSLTFDRAKSVGLEFYLKYDRGGKFTFWSSYALAYADEKVSSAAYQGETYSLAEPVIPNRYDQRHTIYLDLNYRPNRNWHLNASWQYHTGWPYTQKVRRSRKLPDGSTEYYAGYDKLYGARLSPYHRMDLQLSRHVHFSQSRLSFFIALINLYNHDNIRSIKYNWRRDSEGIPYLEAVKGYWFHLLPSLGLSWTWNH